MALCLSKATLPNSSFLHPVGFGNIWSTKMTSDEPKCTYVHTYFLVLVLALLLGSLVGIFLLLLHTYIHSTGFLFAERKHQAAPQMKTFTKGILSIHYAMLLGLVNGKIILHCSLHFLMMVRANNT